MNVGLIVYKNEITNNSSSGMYRYIFELYCGLLHKNICVKTIEPYGSKHLSQLIGEGASWVFGNTLNKFEGLDILHDPNFYRMPTLPKNHVPVTVSTAHDFLFITHPDIVRQDIKTLKERIWLDVLTKIFLKTSFYSDFIIAVSTLTRDDAVRLGYDRKRVFVVNNGIDNRFLTLLPNRKEKTNAFIVGYIGSMGYKKNIKFAIEAFKKIDDDHARFRIWGNKRYTYEKLKTIASPDHRIRFMGMAPETNLINTYDSFDAFIFPTLYEGFGLPILEAQARGLPVVVYKYGMIPKEVRKYCFEAESPEHAAQILEKLKSNGYNERLRKKATEYARSFTWDKTASKVLKIYKSIIN